MILVGQYDSPYTRRVAVALHALGIAFDRDTRSVFADAEAIRAINPIGRIPALVLDDGEVLIDSAAILDHLDEQVGPDRALLPPRGPARRHALRVVALATGVLDKAGAVVYERVLRPPANQLASWLERCEVQVASGLAALAAVVDAGARPTQPDITVGCVLAYRGIEPLLSRYPALAAKHLACEALPAFARARPSPDEQMPDHA